MPTRLKKLSDGMYGRYYSSGSGGIKALGYLSEDCENRRQFRSGRTDIFYEILSKEQFLPAAGQESLHLKQDRRIVRTHARHS